MFINNIIKTSVINVKKEMCFAYEMLSRVSTYNREWKSFDKRICNRNLLSIIKALSLPGFKALVLTYIVTGISDCKLYMN